MKKSFLAVSVLTSLFVSQAFARLEIKPIPLDKAWAIACYMVDSNGNGTTDNQVTSFTLNGKRNLGVEFIDSVKGHNSAQVLLTSIEAVAGGGSRVLTYKGQILNGSRGEMFKNKQELTITLNLEGRVVGRPNTFESEMTLDNYETPKYPLWAAQRTMECVLVPQ